MASLGIVGITRAITYTFQTTAQSAETVANEVDRFAYTLECMFPILLMQVISLDFFSNWLNWHRIDLVGSKMLGGSHYPGDLPSYHPSRRIHARTFEAFDEAPIYAGNTSKHSAETHTRALRAGSGSSQGPIFPFAKAATRFKACGNENSTSEEWIDDIAMPGNIVGGIGFEEFGGGAGIQKTVEFELREYDALNRDKESNGVSS